MCDSATFPDCLAVVIARRKQLQMAQINRPHQLVKPQSSKRVLQAGAEKRRAREGEGGPGEAGTERGLGKMLAPRVRWRE